MSRQIILTVSDVSKSFAGNKVLHNISFAIQQGEKVAIIGSSGAGKTTLLHLIAGIIQPDSGYVHINGKSLNGLKPGRELSELVGVIHQQFDLVPQISVVQNVLVGRLGQWSLLRSILSMIWPIERGLASKALARVGLSGKQLERTSNLSGGEQQRVAIARMLVQDPELFVADEPVASLDPTRASYLIELLGQVTDQTGKTLVTSLHSLDLVRKNFTRLIGLRNGIQVFDLDCQDVTDRMIKDLYDIEEIGT